LLVLFWRRRILRHWVQTMRQLIVAGAAALALCLSSTPAVARDIPDGGLTLEQVAAWLQAAGYKAEIQTEGGKRNIYSGAEGNAFHISQYDCKGDVCGSLQFWVGFDTKGAFSTDRINTWNRENRWLRAYVDKVNDPWLEMDVDLTPGGTYENLSDEFAIWRDGLRRFKQKNPM
jgi:Putative bacterial sensory transduction regulator